MKNKRGWIRIMEAFIAIVLIASVLLTLYSRQVYHPDRGDEIKKIIRGILEDIERNDQLREKILTSDVNSSIGNPPLIEYNPPSEVYAHVQGTMPPTLNYELKICNTNNICGLTQYVKGNVYADEVIISSTLQSYGPRKVKLYVWEK